MDIREVICLMKKMLFIMNPISGMRRAAKHLADILNLYNRAGYETLVHLTGCQGDAREVVLRHGKDVDIIVCCGGDGTLNETISGVMESGVDTPIGYIPAGSTNDLAASLKLSNNIMQAAQDILDSEPVAYDVGRFGGRYFSYVASFGAFTRTSYTTPQSIKNALGHTAYVLGGISELSQLRKEHVRIELEDRVVEDDFIFGAVSNSTSVGGILALDPKVVDMSDGLLEILLVRAPKNLAELSECLIAMQTMDYGNCSVVTFLSARKLKIFADPEMPWTLDGEREDGHDEVLVENLHQRIRLMKKVEKHD